jgi:hypothetical protein
MLSGKVGGGDEPADRIQRSADRGYLLFLAGHDQADLIRRIRRFGRRIDPNQPFVPALLYH